MAAGADPGSPGGDGPPRGLEVLPPGTATGTLVHRLLEEVDFAATDVEAHLARAVRRELVRRRLGSADADEVTAGLAAALRTPLGPLAAGRRLVDFRRCDTVREMAFELPLRPAPASPADAHAVDGTGDGSGVPTGGAGPQTAAGERVGTDHGSGGRSGGAGPGTRAGEGPADLTLARVAELVARHTPTGDPLAGYPARLADAAGGALSGFLTGSIDLVLRTPAGSFVVVDHKTNHLAPEPSGYGPGAMAAAMIAGHYPLQALLYSVALHRYLRWRLAGYDPGAHLGGVLYLFLRAMVTIPSGDVPGSRPVGPGDGSTGVFSWRPPALLVTELSDLFDRGPGT